jgi:protein-S-isoprenylcysteine O-methyltransferase Ste14
MFLRALIAFLTLPAIVGGLIPWLLLPGDQWRTTGTWLGLPVLLLGICILAWCVRDFYVIGKGTLAPWDPPKRLVVVGLYRWIRNPMYVGILAIVAGWGLAAGSPLLAVYAVVLAIAFHLRVILYEEPTLARLFGEDWMRYRATVHRWFPL